MAADRSVAYLAACCGLLIAGLSSSACNLPRGTAASPSPAPPAATETQASCPPQSLVAPDVPTQDSLIRDSLRPSLAWSYAGECPPDEFQVEVAPLGDFGGPEIIVARTAAQEVSWTPPQDLVPVTHFAWRVAAASAGVLGPYSISQEFWTGPVCGGAGLLAPQLSSPADGTYVDTPYPSLDIDYPGTACLQEWFSIDVSPDPDFATEALHASFGPATEFDTEAAHLNDCTLYYWRAKAIFGEDISGPYSPASAFYTDFGGGCAPHTGLPRISGAIWLDACEAAGSASPSSPAGCVWQEGGLVPDGVRQEMEPAIPGLLVRVAPGICTSPDMGWTTGPTDEDGRYSQVVLPDTYCVWVFRDRDGNDAVLGSGRWTHPPGGYDAPVRYEIVLDWGQERSDLDFAWWRR
jgi:hypothetical protein